VETYIFGKPHMRAIAETDVPEATDRNGSSLTNPKDWAISFLVVLLCYLAGELGGYFLGIARSESVLLIHFLQRMVYGSLVLASIGALVFGVVLAFLGTGAVGLFAGKWPWQK
jgi:hypothetical protein